HRRGRNDRSRRPARLRPASARPAARGQRARQPNAAGRMAAAGGGRHRGERPAPPRRPGGGPGGAGDCPSAARTMRLRLVRLTLGAGPHARAYTLTAGTERWLFWELRACAATAFVGSTVRGYAELWRVVAADVNVPESFDHAQGGEAGMILRLGRSPLDARVG